MLLKMPNYQTLMELLECSTNVAQLCREQGEQRGLPPCVEGLMPADFLRVSDATRGRSFELMEYAFNLKNIAQFIATAAPSLIEAAMGFDKVVGIINPMLRNLLQTSSELNSTSAKLEKVRSKCESLESSLEAYAKRDENKDKVWGSRVRFL